MTLTERIEHLVTTIQEEEASLALAEQEGDRRAAAGCRRELVIVYEQKDRLTRTHH